ncbi:hypothetical protein BJX76DRAFT_328078 [Aspergillus varians]
MEYGGHRAASIDSGVENSITLVCDKSSPCCDEPTTIAPASMQVAPDATGLENVQPAKP